MSLYSCIELIEARLGSPNADSFFLTLIKKDLEARISSTTEDYSNLNKEIKKIVTYLERHHRRLKNNNDFHNLLTDLIEMRDKFENSSQTRAHASNNQSPDLRASGDKFKHRDSHSKKPSKNEAYEIFQSPKYRIALLDQNESYKLGASDGECYGFTLAMVDPTLSPYKNKVEQIDLTEKIYNYQKNQRDREKDQELIKRTRLTHEYFCPNPRKRAQKLFDFATEHQGKELQLALRCSAGKHACYLSIQNDQEIRYMDPNHGVYLFDNKKDFIDFYVAAAQKEKEKGIDFHFYALAELVYDERPQLVEARTLMGKIRTLLMGSKYDDHDSTALFAIESIHAIIGATIGGFITSMIPVLPSEVAMLGGGLVGGLTITAISKLARTKGHQGLLGIPYLLLDNWYYEEEISEEFSPEETQELSSEEESQVSSTATVLLEMKNNPPNSNSQSVDHEEKSEMENESLEIVTIPDEVELREDDFLTFLKF
jgi:hypothetical protein